jgi:hypothetical protein
MRLGIGFIGDECYRQSATCVDCVSGFCALSIYYRQTIFIPLENDDPLDQRIPRGSEKGLPERSVSVARDGHQLGELRLIAEIVEQRVRSEVRPCKEAMFNAVAQHAQGRSFVTQDRI